MDKVPTIKSENALKHKGDASLSSSFYTNAPESSHAEEEQHVDERWLVSYSDMMTLLFGFFVMLYSLAMENSSEVLDDMIRRMSVGVKYERKISSETPTPTPDPRIKMQESEMQRLKADNKMKMTKINRLLSSLKMTQKENADLKNRVDEIMKEIEKRRREFKNLTSQQDQDQAEIKSKAAMLQELTNQLEKLQVDNQRVVDLEKELSIWKGQAASTKFVTVIIEWETKDHDVDLIVVDPDGVKYNFENRKYQGNEGELIIDSRTGPGIEVWKSANAKVGVYKIYALFYSHYSNPDPVAVTGSVLSRNKSLQFPRTIFTNDGEQKLLAAINVKSDGSVELVDESK